MNITTNLKIKFYVEKEIQDIMIEFYQIKRNLIISTLFLFKHNCIPSRQVMYKKFYDISRKGSHHSSDTNHPTPATKSQYYKSQGINIFYYILSVIWVYIHPIVWVRIFIQLFNYRICILLIISYCKIIHPVICNIVILWLVSDDWCRMSDAACAPGVICFFVHY